MNGRTVAANSEKKTAAAKAISRGVNQILREAYALHTRDRATRAAVKRMLGSARVLVR